MTAIKEKIIGAVTVMTDADAEAFWNIIVNKYSSPWDCIEEEAPDEIDRRMLEDIKNNPDCHVFTHENEIDWQ